MFGVLDAWCYCFKGTVCVIGSFFTHCFKVTFVGKTVEQKHPSPKNCLSHRDTIRSLTPSIKAS